MSTPAILADSLSSFQAAAEAYGWYVLFGVIVLLYLRKKVPEYLSRRTLQDPVRNERLTAGLRASRERMVKKWEEEREEIIQESEQQKKNQKHDREAGLKGFDPNKRVKKRVNDDDLGALFGSSGNQSALSSYRPSIENRYNRRPGGGGRGGG